MKTISLKIDPALDQWLEEEAKKLGRTKSEIAREALDQRRQGLKKQSIHELMQEFCGSIKGGPKDFATHRKYLKGFGR